MLIIGAGVKSEKYNFKTIKIRPLTYKRLIKFKSTIENDRQELYSFDEIINHILYILEKEEKVETFSANDIKQNELPKENG